MRSFTKDRIGIRTKLAYGAGVSYSIVDQIFVQWVLYFYLPPASSGMLPILSPMLLSLALGLSRFIDIIADPLVGYFSDRTDSKLGRRIPYIAIGILPLSISIVAFFYPIFETQNLNFIYLTVVGALFFIFYTLVGGPYNALIPEIGENRDEQLSLSMWQSVFRLLYSAIATIIPGMLIKYLGGGDEKNGIRGMVIVLSILSLLGGLITVFFVNERKYSNNKKLNINLRESLGIIFKNKNFWFYLLGLLMLFTGFNTVRSLFNYFIEDIMGYGKGAIALTSALLFVTSVIFFPIISKMSKKLGYKRIMLYSITLFLVLTICLFLVGILLPIKTGFIIFGLLGIPMAGGAFILPPAMLSDISRKIAKEKGINIEGISFGIQGFFLKMAFFISIMVLPQLITESGGMVHSDGIYKGVLFAIFSFIAALYFYSKYEE